MIKVKSPKFMISSIILILLETALFIIIQTGGGPSIVSYALHTVSCIVLALIFVCLFYQKTRLHTVMVIALSATVCADFFLSGLVLFDGRREIAMVFFNAVQICYGLRISFGHTTKKQRYTHLAVRLSLITVFVVASLIVLGKSSNLLSIVSMIYFGNLLTTTAFSFVQIKKSVLFPIGLVFFCLCDVFVGLNVLEELYMLSPATVLLTAKRHITLNMPWLFYVPSQTLIALSVKDL